MIQFSLLVFYERVEKSGIIGNLVSEDFGTMCFVGQINSSFEYDEFEFRKSIFELVNKFNGPENFYVKFTHYQSYDCGKYAT